MKFVFATDSHLKGRNPSSRLDNFQEAVLAKLEELCQEAVAINATAILHGGDLFDVPDVSNNLIGRVAAIIKNYGIPFYVVPGNHDLYGYSMKSLPQTSLGVLERAGVVKLLTRYGGPKSFWDSNTKVAIQGQEYYADIDKGNPLDYEFPKSIADHKILIPHSMLVPKEFFPGVPCTLTKDVKSDADLILVGHYHPGYNDHTIGTTRFINPGSMARLDATTSSINRLPQYLIITAEKNQPLDVTFHDFKSAQPGNVVLDNSHLKAKAVKTQQLQQFQNTIASVQQYSANDVNTILNQLAATNGLPQVILDGAIERLKDAEANDKAATDTSGFVEENQNVRLIRIELENFQSHEDTVVELSEGLNAFIGQSDSGKTSLADRAVRWAVYNEPKGTDFIRNTANDARVRLVFSTGKFIERYRTRKNAGRYTIGEIDLVSGQVLQSTDFEGFGTHIPPEIASIAQMPKSNLGRGDAETLNFAHQLDAPFLISEGGATKAAVIGRLTGVHLVDTAIASVGTDINRATRESNATIKNMETLREELKKYDHLPDMKNHIDQVEKKMEYLALGVDRLETLQKVKRNYEGATTALQELQQEQQKFAHLPLAQKRMVKLEQAYPVYKDLVSIRKEIETAEERLNGLKIEKVSLPNLAAASKRLEKLEKAVEIFKELKTIQTHTRTAMVNIRNLKDDLHDAEEDRKEIDAQLNELLESIDVCPVCERPMDSHNH